MNKEQDIIIATLKGYHSELNARFDNETVAAALLEQAETLCRGAGLSMAVAFELAEKVNPFVGEYR